MSTFGKMSYYTEYSKGKMPLRYVVFANQPRYPIWVQIVFLLLAQLIFWSTLLLLFPQWGSYATLVSFLLLFVTSLAMKSSYEEIGFLEIDEGRVLLPTEKGETLLNTAEITSFRLEKKIVLRSGHVKTFVFRCETISNEVYEIHVSSAGFLEKDPPHFHTTPPSLPDVLRHFAEQGKIRYSIKS